MKKLTDYTAEELLDAVDKIKDKDSSIEKEKSKKRCLKMKDLIMKTNFFIFKDVGRVSLCHAKKCKLRDSNFRNDSVVLLDVELQEQVLFFGTEERINFYHKTDKDGRLLETFNNIMDNEIDYMKSITEKRYNEIKNEILKMVKPLNDYLCS